MKSLHESQKHEQIHEVREEKKTAARLGEITGERAVRILTDTLTRWERRERRDEAGIQEKNKKKKRIRTPKIQPSTPQNRDLSGEMDGLLGLYAWLLERKNLSLSDTTPEIKPEKMDHRTLLEVLTPEAIKGFLSELWDITTQIDNRGNHWASISWVVLSNTHLQSEDWLRREIMGWNQDEALRNYFKNAITPGTTMLKRGDEYEWGQAGLTFIKKQFTEIRIWEGWHEPSNQVHQTFSPESEELYKGTGAFWMSFLLSLIESERQKTSGAIQWNNKEEKIVMENINPK